MISLITGIAMTANMAVLASGALQVDQSIFYPVSNNALEAQNGPLDESNTEKGTNPTPEQFVDFVRQIFGDRMVPYIYQLAKCESTLRQFDSKGRPVLSETNDVGILQVNLELWLKKSKEMGLDVQWSWKDNVRMSKWLFDRFTFRAWNCRKALE